MLEEITAMVYTTSSAYIIAMIIADAWNRKRKRRFFYLTTRRVRKKAEGANNMAQSIMVKELIGKNIKLATINKRVKGKVAEITDDWVKVVLKNGKEHMVKEDMIIWITVL